MSLFICCFSCRWLAFWFWDYGAFCWNSWKHFIKTTRAFFLRLCFRVYLWKVFGLFFDGFVQITEAGWKHEEVGHNTSLSWCAKGIHRSGIHSVSVELAEIHSRKFTTWQEFVTHGNEGRANVWKQLSRG